MTVVIVAVSTFGLDNNNGSQIATDAAAVQVIVTADWTLRGLFARRSVAFS
jgi:hypothetical protein